MLSVKADKEPKIYKTDKLVIAGNLGGGSNKVKLNTYQSYRIDRLGKKLSKTYLCKLIKCRVMVKNMNNCTI